MTNNPTIIPPSSLPAVGEGAGDGTALVGSSPLRTVLESRLADWLEYLVDEEEAAPGTAVTYERGVLRFLDWLEQNPEPVSKATFIRYRTDLKSAYSPATVNISLTAVRRFLDWLELNGDIPGNPATGVKGLKDKGRGKVHKRDVLTDTEALRLLAAPDLATAEGKRDRAILAAMLYGGLRQVEIARADIGSYRTRSNRRVLYLWGKGRSEADEYIVVNPELESALADWLAVHPDPGNPEAALFPSLSNRSHGSPLSTSAIRRLVMGYMRSAGIRDKRKTTHSLRHTFLTSILAHGGTIYDAQRAGRHADPSTTAVYAHDVNRLQNPPEFLVRYK